MFGYADAIRERVFIDSPYDSDKNGVKDIIAIDIKRPKATNEGLKAPVVMDPSPYYSTLGRGNESQLKRDYDGDGLLDLWPLFYDNYFVPRGYAVILMDMIGTNNSTGCPNVHDDSDNLSAKVVIDWLNGRARGVDKNGVDVTAPWHNGKTGLIGKSYDGTLANAVAASGVEGLTTIVPISAIASYYDYTRTNGVIQRGNNYLASLANTVTNPDRRAYCAPVRDGARRQRRRRERRLQRLLGRPRLPQGPRQGQGQRVHHARHPGRERARRPLLQVVVRPQGAQRPAQAVDHAPGPRRPVRRPPRRLGGHDPPLVRLLAPGRPERDHERARGGHRGVRGQLEDLHRLADPGHADDRRLPAGHDADRAGRARRQLAAARRTR